MPPVITAHSKRQRNVTLLPLLTLLMLGVPPTRFSKIKFLGLRTKICAKYAHDLVLIRLYLNRYCMRMAGLSAAHLRPQAAPVRSRQRENVPAR